MKKTEVCCKVLNENIQPLAARSLVNVNPLKVQCQAIEHWIGVQQGRKYIRMLNWLLWSIQFTLTTGLQDDCVAEHIAGKCRSESRDKIRQGRRIFSGEQAKCTYQKVI